MYDLLSGGTNIVFMWVPSDVGLPGNSVKDISSKAAVLLPVSNLTVPHSDCSSLICTQALNHWQQNWSSETLNKLHAIESRVNVIILFRLLH